MRCFFGFAMNCLYHSPSEEKQPAQRIHNIQPPKNISDTHHTVGTLDANHCRPLRETNDKLPIYVSHNKRRDTIRPHLLQTDSATCQPQPEAHRHHDRSGGVSQHIRGAPLMGKHRPQYGRSAICNQRRTGARF